MSSKAPEAEGLMTTVHLGRRAPVLPRPRGYIHANTTPTRFPSRDQRKD